jgi:hypothetical protein
VPLLLAVLRLARLLLMLLVRQAQVQPLLC